MNAGKNFFKEQVKALLGESKAALISKAGGATDVEYLFDGCHEMIASMLDDDFFAPLISRKRIDQIKQDMASHSEWTVRLMYLFVFNKLFVSRDFDSKLGEVGLQVSLKDLLRDPMRQVDCKEAL